MLGAMLASCCCNGAAAALNASAIRLAISSARLCASADLPGVCGSTSKPVCRGGCGGGGGIIIIIGGGGGGGGGSTIDAPEWRHSSNDGGGTDGGGGGIVGDHPSEAKKAFACSDGGGTAPKAAGAAGKPDSIGSMGPVVALSIGLATAPRPRPPPRLLPPASRRSMSSSAARARATDASRADISCSSPEILRETFTRKSVKRRSLVTGGISRTVKYFGGTQRRSK